MNNQKLIDDLMELKNAWDAYNGKAEGRQTTDWELGVDYGVHHGLNLVLRQGSVGNKAALKHIHSLSSEWQRIRSLPEFSEKGEWLRGAIHGLQLTRQTIGRYENVHLVQSGDLHVGR